MTQYGDGEDLTALMNWVRSVTYERYDNIVDDDPTFDNMSGCSKEKFESVLQNGFDVNQQNDTGASLLGIMISNNYKEKINILLEFNPNVSLTNNDGQNIYFGLYSIADSNEGIDLVERLLSLDVDGDLATKGDLKEVTPLQTHKKVLNDHIHHFFNPKRVSIRPIDIMIYQSKIDYLTQLIMRIENHIKRKTTLFSFMLQHLYE